MHACMYVHTCICRDQGPKCSCLCIAHPPLCSPGWHLWPVQRTWWAARCFTTFQMAPKRSWNRTSKPGCKRLWINKYIHVQLHSYTTTKWLCIYINIYIYMVSTPMISWVPSRILGRTWWCNKPDRHHAAFGPSHGWTMVERSVCLG